MLHYILVGRELVPVSLMDWADWFAQPNDRVVGSTVIGGSTVSTVFVGFDYAKGVGAPLVYQTAVFGGPLDGEVAYAATWTNAELAHTAMVQRVVQTQD